ncbi:DUF6516 family protein [Paenisporosarcina sp. TG20]|uniref:DUF6516 family protein n=1 Tax=Paenisporosarcina sp. TG20 TaxID=1211706 RepID=UPI0002E529DE|nr:DUF6516 family protein [Paenisporosarcina sp. TG20]
MSVYQQHRIDEIQRLFEENQDLFNTKKPEMVKNKAKGISKVVATLPLNDHPEYGETILNISETVDDKGNIESYHYGWELSQRVKKRSKQERHLTAFGNEDHSGPPMFEPDPYHHHQFPHQPAQRKHTNVQDLETVVEILKNYIVGGLTYDQLHKF